MQILGTDEKLIIEGEAALTPLPTSVDEAKKTRRKVIHLSRLSGIAIADTLADDQSRADKEHRRERNASMATGAVLGGLIDASSGDDGIVDGLLIGAAFGAIASGSPRDPKARLVLVFDSGERLAVSVDADEYAQIQAAQGARNDNAQGPAIIERDYNSHELRDIESRADVHNKKALFFYGLVSIGVLSSLSGIMLLFEDKSNASANLPGQASLHIIADFISGPGGIILLVVWVFFLATRFGLRP